MGVNYKNRDFTKHHPESESKISRRKYIRLVPIFLAALISISFFNVLPYYIGNGALNWQQKGTLTKVVDPRFSSGSSFSIDITKTIRSKTLLESNAVHYTPIINEIKYSAEFELLLQELSADNTASKIGVLPSSQPPQPKTPSKVKRDTNRAQKAIASLKTSQKHTSISNSKSKTQDGFLEAVKACTSLKCLHAAHKLPRKDGQFNFPHALMVGWQKTATTSLYYYLGEHPEVLTSLKKEPEFFTRTCNKDPINGCSLEDQRTYIKQLRKKEFIRSGGKKMVFEASTHYSYYGPSIAKSLHDVLPWVKIVISLREPISRAMSLLIHMADPTMGHKIGCMAQQGADMYTCLMTDSQLSGRKKPNSTTTRHARNLKGQQVSINSLDAVDSKDMQNQQQQPRPRYSYSQPLQSWLEVFGREQVQIVQYERLISEESGDEVLDDFKAFLDLNTTYPRKDLGMHNTRKGRIKPEGWPMTKQQYLTLIEFIKPDAQRVAELVQDYGFGSAREWMSQWEAVWKENLESCDESDLCKIRPS